MELTAMDCSETTATPCGAAPFIFELEGPAESAEDGARVAPTKY